MVTLLMKIVRQPNLPKDLNNLKQEKKIKNKDSNKKKTKRQTSIYIVK